MLSVPTQDVLTLLIGLLILSLGAEGLVRGASKLAAAFGVSPLVIGLTIVAYGTSMPELVVSVRSGMVGQDDIAVANIVGSNIFNVLFILGICACILPLKVSAQLIRLDVPIMIAVSILMWLLSLDGRLQWLDGLLLTALIIAYTIWSIQKSRKETREIQREFEQEYAIKPQEKAASSLLMSVGFVLGGLVLLIFGGKWFIQGSVGLAEYFGLSNTVIGLTIVAAGTSMPEVATSVVATIRGERDIAIGNVVGSNIYNILAILGIASLVTSGGLEVNPGMLAIDIPVMTLVAILCLPIFFTGKTIARWEGLLFFIGYVAYTAYLVTNALPPGTPGG
ncbi:MAG: calcium/sodium antiporter [Pirellulaceae bacterium]|nr:calcium/sodium antiporter [Pirellulaceae bacterium]